MASISSMHKTDADLLSALRTVFQKELFDAVDELLQEQQAKITAVAVEANKKLEQLIRDRASDLLAKASIHVANSIEAREIQVSIKIPF